MLAKLRTLSHSLTFRIAALLALAILPIGVISIAITFQLLRQADRRAEANLLAHTAEAAAPEEAVVRTAMGAAKLLSAMVDDLRAADTDCGAPLQDFLAQADGLAFAGYIAPDGTVACASSGEGRNLSDHPIYRDMTRSMETQVTLAPALTEGNGPAIIIAVPVETGGFVAVTLRHGEEFGNGTAPNSRLHLVTFNAQAELLSRPTSTASDADRLPANVPLTNLTTGSKIAFIDESRAGAARVYAVVPMVEGQVFALGSWPHRRDNLVAGLGGSGLLLLPVAMWLVCLAVAFYAVQRMVIRPTRNLRARMLQFMRSRRLSEPQKDTAIPRELREMEDTWMRLAENVLHDEAKLYDTIHQRTVLLKEVHHRVKNNLQLIVSILNMKVRKARDREVRSALSEIRQRVMGIARVHQNLYETSSNELIQVSELLPAISAQIIQSGLEDPDSVRLQQSYDEMIVYPDQAVPLSLAVTELLTNALKHLGAPEGQEPELRVQLSRDNGDRATLMVCNSLADVAFSDDAPTGNGLGLALVKAFAHQLDGTSDVVCTANSYCATLNFPIAGFDAGTVPEDLPRSA